MCLDCVFDKEIPICPRCREKMEPFYTSSTVPERRDIDFQGYVCLDDKVFCLPGFIWIGA